MAAKIEMFQGDNKTIRVTIVDGDGVTVGDTSGWTIRFGLKLKDTDGANLVTKDSSVGPTEAVHVSTNIWDIFLLRADTTGLSPGIYVYDVEAETDDAPVKFHTVVKDQFKIKLGVTSP